MKVLAVQWLYLARGEPLVQMNHPGKRKEVHLDGRMWMSYENRWITPSDPLFMSPAVEDT